MSSKRAQLVVAALMIAAAGVGFWLLLRPRPIEVELQPPKLVELVVLEGEGKRPLAPGGTVKVGETIDFQLEVHNRCFVYVWTVAGARAELDWGPNALDAAWEPGVYAPDWSEQGLTFERPGPVRLVVVASWVPLTNAPSWSVARLERLEESCPKCRAVEVKLNVVAGDDAGVE